ncbi:hypothetical protein K466DRAFT_607348, partial [Polyporus arcularius HHB13444]
SEANERKRTNKEWSTHDFVQWARALMQKRRDDEAVSLRCEEFRRGREACRSFESAWAKPAETTGHCRGMRAYAYKQVDMYKDKRAEFEAEYDGARRKDVDSEQLDHMRSIRPYLQKLSANPLAFEPMMKHLRVGD